MKSRYVSLRKNPAGSPENKKISYPGKGTRFGKHSVFYVSQNRIYTVEVELGTARSGGQPALNPLSYLGS